MNIADDIAKAYQDGYNAAKQEVSREIFAEIEKWLAYDGDIRMITEEKFAEIKQKFTEGET